MPAAVVFDQVAKTYAAPAAQLRALDGVSFDIEQGEFFGLLGPNGAGKTTLISILAGLTRASSGRVTVMGHDVVADYAAARKALGIVPQELVFDPFFTRARDAAHPERLLRRAPQRRLDRRTARRAWAWPTRPTPTCASSRAA